MRIKTIIAEDDDFSLKFIRNILIKYGDFEIIAEATTGKKLVEKVSELKPDLIFVDIDIPEIDGMTAVRQLIDKFPNLIVVFVTAHADYAVDAFEISSLDYIVKPFNAKRIDKTIIKIRERVKELKQDLVKLASLLKNPEKLYIKIGHEIQFIDADTIFFIEKNQRKTIIYTTKNNYETNEAMQELEDRLNPNFFFRAHKSCLINLRMIERIVPFGESTYMVKFKGCSKDAVMTHQKAHILYGLLNL